MYIVQYKRRCQNLVRTTRFWNEFYQVRKNDENDSV
jgi:hypothetical protein